MWLEDLEVMKKNSSSVGRDLLYSFIPKKKEVESLSGLIMQKEHFISSLKSESHQDILSGYLLFFLYLVPVELPGQCDCMFDSWIR